MTIDKETVPEWFNVVMLDSKDNLKAMRKQADEDCQNDGESILKKMSFTSDKRSISTEEYYFDDGKIYFFADNKLKIKAPKSIDYDGFKNLMKQYISILERIEMIIGVVNSFWNKSKCRFAFFICLKWNRFT